MNLWTTVYVGLGGNIANEHGTPAEHLQRAINTFKADDNFNNVAVSSFYQSKAYGVTDQPDFINAVLKADTCLTPLALLDFCQNLENMAGRVRLRHWGERCLDVDILLYGDEIINHERLIVPHKELMLRNFVVIPMLEINHDIQIHGQRLHELSVANDWQGLSYYFSVSNYIDYYNQKFLSNIGKSSLDELTVDEEKNYYLGLGNYWDWIEIIDCAVKDNFQKEIQISKDYYHTEWYQCLLKYKKLEHRLKLAKKYKQEKRNLIEIMLITSLTIEQINSINI